MIIPYRDDQERQEAIAQKEAEGFRLIADRRHRGGNSLTFEPVAPPDRQGFRRAALELLGEDRAMAVVQYAWLLDQYLAAGNWSAGRSLLTRAQGSGAITREEADGIRQLMVDHHIPDEEAR